MKQSPKLNSIVLSTMTIALVLAGAKVGSAASSIVSARNSSDPRARVFDGKLYLYTSSDLNQGGNWPMNKTYCYSLTDSSADPGLASSWKDNGAVLSESAYAWSLMQNHLWAPDASLGKDGKIYLYVPDTYNSAGGSRIGVSVSSSPLGPFAPPSGFTSSTNYLPSVTGYMSDPSVFADPNDPNGQRYLVYADGDYNSSNFGCGHLSIAKVDQGTTTLTGNQKVQWTNQGSIPNAGGCTPAYIEGAELGYFGGAGTDGNGKYFLYFAIKDNTSYTESIAYATADTVMGPYTYQGIIMSGQGGIGWTNQASIVEWQGHYLFFYHNDPKNQTNPNRQVFLECIGISNGKIGTVTRGKYTTLAACPKASTGMGTGGTPSMGGSSSVGGGTSLATGGTSAGGSGTGGSSSVGGASAGGNAAGGRSTVLQAGGAFTVGGGGLSAGGTSVTQPLGGASAGGRGSGSAVGGTSTSGGNSAALTSGGTTGLANGGTSATGVGLGGTNSTVAVSSGGSGIGGTNNSALGGAPTSSVTFDSPTSDDGCSCLVAGAAKRDGTNRALAVLAFGLLAFLRRRPSF